MRKTWFTLVGVLAFFALPASASGNADAGEVVFARCEACHVVRTPAGELLAGRAARNGPNLFAVVGRPVGAQEGFRYSSALKALAATGAVWDAEALVSFVQDPIGHVRASLGDDGARSTMAYRVQNETAARDVLAYLEKLANGS